MKNKFLVAILTLLVAVVVTSCYSSRKSGCPMSPTANYKFKG